MKPVDRLWYIICYAPEGEEDKYDYAEAVIEDLVKEVRREEENRTNIYLRANYLTHKASLIKQSREVGKAIAEGRAVDGVDIDADTQTKKAMLVGWKAAFDYIDDKMKGF